MAKLTSRDLGARLRQMRQASGYTQEQLAEKVGITPQQVQKYEAGRNMMSADRLQSFAEALAVTICDFFVENGQAVPLRALELALLEAFREIVDEEIQRSIVRLTIHAAGPSRGSHP